MSGTGASAGYGAGACCCGTRGACGDGRSCGDGGACGACGDGGACGTCGDGGTWGTNAGTAPRPAVADPLVYRHGAIKARLLGRIGAAEIDGARPLDALGTRDGDDPAIALIDAFAGALHVLAWNVARLADDGSIRRTEDRDALVDLTRLLGYEPRPALAATTTLAFSISEVKGSPSAATIPKGTKVASIPGQDETPQTFETDADLDARVEWNALVPLQQQTVPQVRPTTTVITIAGTSTAARPGDLVLVYLEPQSSPVKWLCARVREVTRETALDPPRTRIDLASPLALPAITALQGAAFRDQVVVLGQRAAAFGATAPDLALMSEEVRKTQLPPGAPATPLPTEWLDLQMPAGGTNQGGIVDLDAVYPDAVGGRLVVFNRMEGSTPFAQLGRITGTAELNRKGFGLAAKVTRVTVSGIDLTASGYLNKVRETAIYIETSRATLLVQDADVELPSAAPDRITVQGAVNLPAGRRIVLSGERWTETGGPWMATDGQGTATTGGTATATTGGTATGGTVTATGAQGTATGGTVTATGAQGTTTGGTATATGGTGTATGGTSTGGQATATGGTGAWIGEVATLRSCVPLTGGFTQLVFERALASRFRSTTLTLLANCVGASHGETPASGAELIGSGSTARLAPRFPLARSPLSHVPSADPRGYAPAIEVRVGDRLYAETQALYGLGSEDRAYTVRTGREGKSVVQFAGRLPSGTHNVTALYRTGGGTAGNLDAGRLTMLMTPILGVGGVSNPVPADGASDAESIEDLRTAAPQSIRTLDRVVSLSDFEAYARTRRGVGKALATELRVGMRSVVCLTIATTELTSPVAGSDVVETLRTALALVTVPGRSIRIEGFDDLTAALTVALAIDPAFRRADVEAAVRAVLGARFGRAARNFGEALHRSAVLAALHEVEGVIAARLTVFAVPGGPPESEDRLLCPAPAMVDGEFVKAGLLSIDADQVQFAEMLP